MRRTCEKPWMYTSVAFSREPMLSLLLMSRKTAWRYGISVGLLSGVHGCGSAAKLTTPSSPKDQEPRGVDTATTANPYRSAALRSGEPYRIWRLPRSSRAPRST